ncbi:MAG: UDP-N-acetylmuramoyl-L-alanyl-D-glutamate--2,6-diaminopimelate ligase [Candidatus Omnitrophica bacterium]|nr:UDP-N-acetylmuramoyl-L-alanyl-D-glutamate--2,6-diaminopimelate ligase [Candidatus Omnitrophota bacterium]
MLAKEFLSVLAEFDKSLEFEDFQIKGLSLDSRKVGCDFCFIAIKGSDADGHDFIKAALDNGARVIVYDKKRKDALKQIEQNLNLVSLGVKDTRKAAANLAEEFFNQPNEKLKITGITGTNGKTTVSFILAHIFKCNSRKNGIIGTVYYKIADHIISAKNTTPDAITIWNLLYNMVEHGLDYCFMEVSSHALDQLRTEGIDFTHAVFTNITRDHLDYHQGLEKYFVAKAKLFEGLKSCRYAVINADDPYGSRLKQMTKAKLMDYGIKDKQAKIRAENIKLGINGTEFTLIAPGGSIKIKTSIIGRYNVYNILAACAVALIEGIKLESIAAALKGFVSPPGRLEQLITDRPFKVFVDYAHTDDALRNVLETLRELKPSRIIIVFGCGGNRDKKKRSLMGAVASELSDFLVITNDNPRKEDPEAIIDNIITGLPAGFKKYERITDRKKAIEKALNLAAMGDFVLIAGKGHETSQTFKDKTIEFDDKQIALEILKKH